MHCGQNVCFNYSKALHHQLAVGSSLLEEGWLVLAVIWIITLLEPSTGNNPKSSYVLTASQFVRQTFGVRDERLARR